MSGGRTRVDAWFANGHITPADCRVTSYRMHEAISELFEIELTLTLQDDLPMDGATMQDTLESPCAVAFGEADAIGEPVFGVLREWELVDCAHGTESLYRGVVVPTLWYTTQTHRSRVFQALTVPDLVRAVLDEAGLEEGAQYELSLEASYPEREYVVQFEESDFDFLARTLEHEGIAFYFDHAGGSDKVVFVDANRGFAVAANATLPYEESPGIDAGEDADHVSQLRRTLRVVPGRVVLRDSNYRTPQVPLQATASVHDTGLGVVALYGDHFPDVDEGRRLAGVRGEELAVERETLRARGYARSLRAGQKVEIAGHPIAELEQEYLVTAIERRSSVDGEGTDHVLALLPASVPYRPPRVTRRPRIDGLMHARIDGESDGTPAPLDDQGRYRVLLPFDGVGKVGGTASRWMRRAQVYAGPAYGMHFPLHIGTEVLIAHLDGDPDRPVIAAAVPNPATASPALRDNATQSVIRTKANIVQEYEDDA